MRITAPLKPALLLLIVAVAAAGCSSKSYPGDQLKESILKICRDEYHVDNVDVKIVGHTIGVYLPLEKLFAADFKESLVAGKVRNLETLFEPSPEAMDKVEDVLFTISRVLLSTDRDIKFYILQATDVERTGLQLVLKGYVDDVKRVRIWDISRDEYRKRVIYEMKQNRAVVWHKPIRQLFADLNQSTLKDIRVKYFDPAVTEAALEGVFFNTVQAGEGSPAKVQWEVLDMRSTQLQQSEVIVHVKARPTLEGADLIEDPAQAQYLAMVSFNKERPMISRIIPFQFFDEWGNFKKIPFPREIQMEKSFESWDEEFKAEDIQVGVFLAQQLTRRIQTLVAVDERIQHTFREVRLALEYEGIEDKAPSFSLDFKSVALRDFNNYSRESLLFHEDMIYLLSLIYREFVDVLRSYHFGDYDYLSLTLPQETEQRIFGRDDLELFRQNKIDAQALLNTSRI
ncbi:MAG: hypothetical protein Q8R76_08875 [Candidatus Omnitrophota bacterium]|nr:hypothetical protein [Candidatus Omnitrophota bacterium]